MMDPVEEHITMLDNLNVQSLKANIRNLEAIKKWAIASLNLDFKKDDRVEIVSSIPTNTNGWKAYREALAPGQTGIAKQIHFNDFSNKWQVLVGMDRCWSVSEIRRDVFVRYWYGPVSETPAGYNPPFQPDGNIKNFMMDVSWVRRY